MGLLDGLADRALKRGVSDRDGAVAWLDKAMGFSGK